MRRAFVLMALSALGAVPAVALAAGGSSHHFTDHLRGALIETQGKATTYVFKVTTSDVGPGAGVSVNTSTSSTTGATHGVNYFANGSLGSAGTYRIGSPGANGIIPVTVTGHDVGGTGEFKGAHGTFRGTGTDNPKTRIVTLTVTGTISD